MAEETQEQSTGGSLKNVIIGFVSTVTLGVGTWVTTKLTGGDKEEAAPTQQTAPVININNTQQQQQAAGKTVIIKEKSTPAPAAKPAEPAKPKKEGDEFKEKPAQW